jgi:hypothetical protein
VGRLSLLDDDMTPEELLDGLRDGNRHAGGIRCLRLLRLAPHAFARIRGEVERLCRDGVPSEVRRSGHVTSWVLPYGSVLQFSLLNRSGRLDDFQDDHDASRRGKRFADPVRYPGLAELAAVFPTAVNFRVNVLGSASGLSPHEEHVFLRLPDGGVVARVRLHLPVLTSPAAVVVLDGLAYHLEPAIVHLVNHGCVHAARNDAETPRVHLVWDVLLDRATGELLVGPAIAPDPLTRVPVAERLPTPLRLIRVGAVRRLPPPLGAEEIAAARLGDLGHPF